MKLTPIRNKPNLYRHPKTGVIYFRMYRSGLGECERSTGEKTLSEAIKKADKIRADFLGEKYTDKEKQKIRHVVEDLWPEFLGIQKNKSENTYASVEVQGRLHILPFFGDKFPHEITEGLWEQYVAKNQQDTPGRKLFNDWKYLRMFLNYLTRTDRLQKVPKFRNPDPERKKGKVYSDEELERLLDAASPSLRLQILMAVTMGMRKSEILLMSWDRVDLDRKLIHLRSEDTKIRKARSFGMSEQVYSSLTSNSHENGSDYVFPSPVDQSKPIGRDGNKTAWSACKRRARVSGRFHDLRHTFLTKAFKTPINTALICEYAGLSLEEAQRTYLHFTAEDTRAVASLVEVKI